MITQGSQVETKAGPGEVIRINTTMYSIPLYIVKLTGGRHEGEEIATTEARGM